MTTIEEAAKFLHDSGLLFEINRAVLHTRGLALSIIQHDDGRIEFGPLWDERKEGVIFSPESFTEGEEKLIKYDAENPRISASQTMPDGSGNSSGPA